ncbi:hypothetical protein G6F40_017230 [Rhizopus arrhizus]|nr:hypothetical protein G6F40_017230 [Rhizopus arrhizus]
MTEPASDPQRSAQRLQWARIQLDDANAVVERASPHRDGRAAGAGRSAAVAAHARPAARARPARACTAGAGPGRRFPAAGRPWRPDPGEDPRRAQCR